MNCKECHKPIPAGQAVIRSVMFERIAYHKDCYAWVIPAQTEPRKPAHV